MITSTDDFQGVHSIFIKITHFPTDAARRMRLVSQITMENKLLSALEPWLLDLEGAQVKSRSSGGPGGRGELGGSEKCTGPGIGLPPPSPGLSLLHFLLGIGGSPRHHSCGQQASMGWPCGPGWQHGAALWSRLAVGVRAAREPGTHVA